MVTHPQIYGDVYMAAYIARIEETMKQKQANP
jgi:hypothetical protein